jgi:uncharacterized protein YbbK (DUF523 family)
MARRNVAGRRPLAASFGFQASVWNTPGPPAVGRLRFFMEKEMKLVSACLLGIKCNFEGKDFKNEILVKEFNEGNLFPVCPEIMGGLSSPRVPSEIENGDGNDVLENRARVKNEEGIDVTEKFVQGAYKVLEIAKTLEIKEAILIEKSPSCGTNEIFDGTFSFKFKNGDGVTSALLKKNGIKITKIYHKEQTNK